MVRNAALHVDCAIVGGGPAGSAMAWLLARGGHAVALIDDGKGRGGTPRETLLAAAQHGLARSGLSELLAQAAALDSARHGAIWGEPVLRFRSDEERGHVLDRTVFAARLQMAAAAAGAHVLCPGRLLQPVPVTAHAGATVQTLDGEVLLQAKHWVVAIGRAAGRLPEVQLQQAGPRTVAASYAGRCPEGAGLALVEAVPQGFWWWIGDGVAGGVATLFCDGEEARTTGLAELAASARLAACGPAQAMQESRLVQARDATARLCTAGRFLLVGDAAATIDPLASQGVEKAMLAAEHAAAVVVAALRAPALWPRLHALHASFERGLFAAHRRTAAAFYEMETRFADAPFWRRRHSSVPARASATAPIGAGSYVWADQVRCEPVLARLPAGIEETTGLVHGGTDETLHRVGYVPVAPLWPLFAAPSPIAAAVQRAGGDARLFALSPAAVTAALHELVRREWLMPWPGPAAAAGNR